MNDNEEGAFLSRWSRLKQQAREAEAAPSAAEAGETGGTPPELPSVESLSPDSDFRAFLHPQVDDKVRQAALKKLFSDPAFNVMDGLDVYIDDYSKADPLPAAMLAQLEQAQRIVEWAAEAREVREQEARDRTRKAVEQPVLPASGTMPVPNADGAAPPSPASAAQPPLQRDS